MQTIHNSTIHPTFQSAVLASLEDFLIAGGLNDSDAVRDALGQDSAEIMYELDSCDWGFPEGTTDLDIFDAIWSLRIQYP